MVRRALPAEWRELATVLATAIDRLAADDPPVEAGAALLLAVDPELDCIRVRPKGSAAAGVCVALGPLPRATDRPRDDGALVPCGSIDRAASKVAADMLGWHKDPQTCEVVETQRFWLYLQWPGESPAAIYEWAYGLWDE
ncbi:hypothetical protein [Alteraurantiacibacter buctensis]|uniref:Uncharacterized protein n=1 Tax=Alteraurantiacibacter buctensis TaxID=1503981 RepID=A0A844YZF9_9SPHN|nr:hypothetical protein [Alteraurantiacibacter buctensis]MXO71467.1 hypothetical protein [Alteraurantiacibacter buctensis]